MINLLVIMGNENGEKAKSNQCRAAEGTDAVEDGADRGENKLIKGSLHPLLLLRYG